MSDDDICRSALFYTWWYCELATRHHTTEPLEVGLISEMTKLYAGRTSYEMGKDH